MSKQSPGVGESFKNLLGVKPLFDDGGIGWRTTLNIGNSDRIYIHVNARERRRLFLAKAYPLLLPLTLCSEKVMSL
jgi:hypothetical protein